MRKLGLPNYSQQYIDSVVEMARGRIATQTVKSILEQVSPDENGRMPTLSALRKWLRRAGMQNQRGRKHGFSESYTARYVEMARRNTTMSVAAMMAAIGPDKRGRVPDPSTIRGWLRNRGISTGTFSQAYREKTIRTAKAHGCALTLARLAELTGPDERGMTPTPATVSLWMRDAGVDLISSRYSAEDREELRAMIEDAGMSFYTAGRRFRKAHGYGPSDDTLARWFPRYEPKRARKGTAAPLVLVDEAQGDSWQAAWDAADALPDDTPQWVRDQVMLSAWLPDTMMGHVETARLLRTNRRKRRRDEDDEAGQQAGRLAA